MSDSKATSATSKEKKVVLSQSMTSNKTDTLSAEASEQEDETLPEFLLEMMTQGRYFMGFFWWYYEQNGSFFLTWWKFFGPSIKRTIVRQVFWSIGFTVGFMLARKYLVPEHMKEFYNTDTFMARSK